MLAATAMGSVGADPVVVLESMLGLDSANMKKVKKDKNKMEKGEEQAAAAAVARAASHWSWRKQGTA